MVPSLNAQIVLLEHIPIQLLVHFMLVYIAVNFAMKLTIEESFHNLVLLIIPDVLIAQLIVTLVYLLRLIVLRVSTNTIVITSKFYVYIF